MKYAPLKVLTVLLAVSLLTLTAVGCGQRNQSGTVSSDTPLAVSEVSNKERSAASDPSHPSSAPDHPVSAEDSASSPEESSTVSEPASLVSDRETSDTSVTSDTSDTSDQISTDEPSVTESSAEESTEPSEEPIDIAAVAVGNWSMADGVNHINLTLHEDGTVIAEISGMMDHPIGSWRVEDEQVIVTLLETPSAYCYENDHLISVENPNEVYERGTVPIDKPEESQATTTIDPETLKNIVSGDWTMTNDEGYTNLTLAEDGVVTAELSGLSDSIIGSWRVDGSSVILTLSGADAVYDYVGDMLLNHEDPSEGFYRGTTVAEG